MDEQKSRGHELNYQQITAQRALGSAFASGGLIDYNFSFGGTQGFIPDQSYFRIELEVKGTGGTAAPTRLENIALADGAVGNLFQSCAVKMGGQDVSALSGFLPQVNMLKARMNKPNAWMESIGKESFGFDPSLMSRAHRLASDPDDSKDDEVYKVLLGPASGAATYAIAVADTTANAVGTGTTFVDSGVQVGDTVVLGGVVRTVAAVADNTHLTLSAAVSPAIAATGGVANAYKVVRRNPTEGKNRMFMLWTPPIGFFDINEPLGSGDYRITLNPNASYKTSIVEMLKKGVAGTDFDVIVHNMTFFAAKVAMSQRTSKVEKLYLNETYIQPKTADGSNVIDFTVPGSTKSVSVFIQAKTAGEDTRCPPSMFRSIDGSEKNITSLQIRYANENKPSTNWDSEYSTSNQKLSQRYVDSNIYANRLFESGGVESFKDWLTRGAYYHFSFERDSEFGATNLQLDLGIAGLTPLVNNVFIVAHYTRMITVSSEAGRITDVKSADV